MGYGIITGVASSVVAYTVWEGMSGGLLEIMMIGGLCIVWFGAGILSTVEHK